MKFQDSERFAELYEEIAKGGEQAYREFTEYYLEKIGADPETVQTKAEFIFDTAHSIAQIQDSQILETKIRKATREISYDSIKMNPVKQRISEYLKMSTSKGSFVRFWNSIKVEFFRLKENSPSAYEKAITGIMDRKLSLDFSSGHKEMNIFEEISRSLRISEEEHESFQAFLNSLYDNNMRLGGTEVGKGEYLLDFFVNSAFKGSDISISGVEYEVKTKSSNFGEILGSKEIFTQGIQGFFDSEEENKMSFGLRDFEKIWWPIFEKVPSNRALKFLEFQTEFTLKKRDERMLMLAMETIKNLSLETLIHFYDELCIEHLKKSLGQKNMIIFGNSGNMLILDADSVQKFVGFAANPLAKIKIGLNAGNATGSRPYIADLKI